MQALMPPYRWNRLLTEYWLLYNIEYISNIPYYLSFLWVQLIKTISMFVCTQAFECTWFGACVVAIFLLIVNQLLISIYMRHSWREVLSTWIDSSNITFGMMMMMVMMMLVLFLMMCTSHLAEFVSEWIRISNKKWWRLFYHWF